MEKKGRVIQSTGKWYKVTLENEEIMCRLPGRFRLDKKEVTNPVAVGDYVSVEMGEDGTGQITEIFERENYIPRQATHGRRGEQVLISNIDRAWVVQSVREPAFNQGFTDRFLVICEAYEVPAGIIINKADLAGKGDEEYMNDMAGLYRGIGYPVLITSINNPGLVGELASELKDLVSVFIGPSGTGKSSLLNAIEPGLNLRVGEISSYSKKGKHTTTFASLVPLSQGGYIADTPGIRELGLVQIGKPELSLYFPEMTGARDKCKFYNCTHDHEPGCGVAIAYENGEISAGRYNSYLNILDTLD